MALPPLRVQLMVDQAWTDITTNVLARDGITISRGRADEAAQPDPSSCQLSLANRDGRYSPRNPRSPLYGKIGRNTAMRVGLGIPPAGAATTGLTGTSISAPSVTAEVAGGLFCVWGAAPVGNWTTPGGFTAGTERDGLLSSWQGAFTGVSPGATSPATATYSTPATAAAALSVFIPGASLTAAGFTGVTTAGTGVSYTVTGLAAGQYLLAIQGWSSDSTDKMKLTPSFAEDNDADWMLIADTGPTSGPRIKAWISRVPAGVASTSAVLFPGPGTGGGDNYGRVWLITGASDYYCRHTGETTWPQRSDGIDAWVPVTSSGILRRLAQGAAPLRSSLNRHISKSANVVAYWPLEDATTAAFSSPIAGVAPGKALGTPELGADDGFLGSNALPTWLAAGFSAEVPPYVASGQLFAGVLVAIPAAGTSNGANLLSVGLNGGSLSRVVLEYRTGGALAIKLINTANAVVENTATGDALDGKRAYAWIALTEVSGNINWSVNTIRVVDAYYNPSVTQTTGTTVGHTIGAARTAMAGIEGDANGPLSLTTAVTIGHVTVASKEQAVFRSDYPYYYPAVVGWFAEGAVDRITRLCREEGIDVANPWSTVSTALGPQRSGTLLDLLQEAATADGGILYEPRGLLGLAYRSRPSIQNRAADLTLDHSAGQVVAPFEPVDDDQATRNDITVTRIGGAAARAELTHGPLSTQPPPDGIGRYDDAVDLSLWLDSQAADAAGWRLHLGTWDEARYPSVSTLLHKSTTLIPAAAGLDCGDRVQVTNLPDFLPPGPVLAIAQGYSEDLNGLEWSLTLNCSPAGPYRVGQFDSAVYGRLDSEDSTLAEDLTTTETGVDVAVAVGSPLWITTVANPTEFPFDVVFGGEVVTVSAITGALEDAFGRTVVDSWGTADTGQTWTATGLASYWDVNGSAGTFTNGGAVNVEGVQEVAGPWSDVDLRAQVTFQSLPVGANIVAGLWARRGTSAKVKARLFHTTGDVLNVDILGTNAAVILGSVTTVLTGVNGVAFKARLLVVGTAVKLKVWRGAVEPTAWTLEVTDTVAPAAGGVAVSALRQTSNTNVNPVVEFDNLAVVNPQTFTVTRSANGVVKAQTAGTQIRLAYPSFFAQGGDPG